MGPVLCQDVRGWGFALKVDARLSSGMGARVGTAVSSGPLTDLGSSKEQQLAHWCSGRKFKGKRQ